MFCLFTEIYLKKSLMSIFLQYIFNSIAWKIVKGTVYHLKTSKASRGSYSENEVSIFVKIFELYCDSPLKVL